MLSDIISHNSIFNKNKHIYKYWLNGKIIYNNLSNKYRFMI